MQPEADDAASELERVELACSGRAQRLRQDQPLAADALQNVGDGVSKATRRHGCVHQKIAERADVTMTAPGWVGPQIGCGPGASPPPGQQLERPDPHRWTPRGCSRPGAHVGRGSGQKHGPWTLGLSPRRVRRTARWGAASPPPAPVLPDVVDPQTDSLARVGPTIQDPPPQARCAHAVQFHLLLTAWSVAAETPHSRTRT